MSSPHSGTDSAAKAAANAALEGISLDADERELIQARRDGQLDHQQFLRAARELAQSKTREKP